MIQIDKQKCSGCGLCIQDCLLGEIQLMENKATEKNKMCFHCGHCIAICPQGAIHSAKKEDDACEEYDEKTFSVDPENLLHFIKFRRSVRSYQNKPVEKEKLEKLIEAGRFTPTSANSQGVQYYVVSEGIQELCALVSKTLDQMADEILDCKQEKSDPSLVNYAHKWKDIYAQHKNGRDLLFYGAPTVIILTINTKRNKTTGSVDASLAASNMELMANAQGLGACYNGFFGFAEKQNPKIREFLGLDQRQQVVIAFALGYPARQYQRTVPRSKPKVKWL